MGSPSMGSSAAMWFRLRPALQFMRDYFVELATATATAVARRSRAYRSRRAETNRVRVAAIKTGRAVALTTGSREWVSVVR